MPKPTSKKGKPSGDDSGEGGNSGVTLGTAGDDILRGSRADDIFRSFGGSDEIYGRTGYDILQVEGSVWDYEWLIWGGTWQLWKWNSPDKVVLHDVEEIQFSDYTIVLGEELPLEILQAPPDQLVVEAGGEGSFKLTLRDMDDQIDVKLAGPIDTGYGTVWLEPDYDKSIYGNNSQELTYTVHYDFDRFYNPYISSPVAGLAKGEEHTITVVFDVTTSNFWLDADEPGRGETHQLTFDLVIVGKNEAPTISGHAEIEALEDAGETRFDLSAFGDDIDSDDDGSTLTYEIINAPEGFDVRIEGSELVLTASTLLDTATSDEVMTGEVTLRAIDAHGAVTQGVATVGLTLRGVDDTPAPPSYLLADGSIDFDALGVGEANVLDYGTAIVDTWHSDPQIRADIKAATTGDDLKVIKAGSLATFDNSDAINLGDGNDIFVFQSNATSLSYFSFNDILGGAGEDVVAIELTSSNESSLHGGLIDTGAQSDTVLIDIEFGYQGWWTSDIETGSGHDVVDLSLTATGPAGEYAEVLMVGGIDLGTGNDTLRLVAGDNGMNSLQEIDFSIFAGDGDDAVLIDLSELGISGFISPEQDPTGVFSDRYKGGFEGYIDLGAGDDMLDLTLPEAYKPVSGTLQGGDGYDVLILGHLTASDVATEVLSDGGLRLSDGTQVLDLYGFESVLLGGDTDILM